MWIWRLGMTASEGGWERVRVKGKEEEGRLPAVIDSFQYLRFAARARYVIIYAALHVIVRCSAHYLGTFSEVRSAAISARIA